MERLHALLKIIARLIFRTDGKESAIGPPKESKLHPNRVFLEELTGKAKDMFKSETNPAKTVKHLSVFAVKGNFHEVIGKENGVIFEINDPNSGNLTYLFRVFGGENSQENEEICQYIGLYTGKLTKNISFLPGCECVYIGNFPVETASGLDVTIGNIRNEVLYMANLCSQASLIQTTTALAIGNGVSIPESTEKKQAISMVNAALKYINGNTRQQLLTELENWTFFNTGPMSEYLITFAVNEMQTRKAAEAMWDTDRWLRANVGLHAHYNACRNFTAGATVILYPRTGGIEEILGCAAVHPRPTRSGGKIDRKSNILLSVWVCPELRGKGYGKSLVRKAASICRGKLVSFLPFDDEDDTYGALKFFRACGCRNSVVDTRDYFGVSTQASVGDRLHRILVLDDMSQT